MQRTALCAAAAFATLLVCDVAAACSDAGPPNSCNEGGAAWIECSVHADCPSGQRCLQGGFCTCLECAYGEQCDDDGCRCAAQTRPSESPGCEVVQDSCGTYRVECHGDAGTAGRCTLDGGACDDARPAEMSAGCAAAPGRAPLGGLALLALALPWLRRAARRRA
ncbi:MAG: hypothetical protein KF729_22410 [Sandaracinaceae bacterium]|nr:hypothetical protein [Sandaracinaceae bacterium]